MMAENLRTGCVPLVIPLLIFVLAGCGSADPAMPVDAVATTPPTVNADAGPPPATAEPITPAAESTASGEQTTTAGAAPATPTEAIDWTQTASVDGDLYVLGNPAAPIRFIDYSDFL